VGLAQAHYCSNCIKNLDAKSCEKRRALLGPGPRRKGDAGAAAWPHNVNDDRDRWHLRRAVGAPAVKVEVAQLDKSRFPRHFQVFWDHNGELIADRDVRIGVGGIPAY
jgi:hypothetical protein